MPPFVFLPLVFWLLVLGGGFYLAVRFIRALEQRRSDPPELSELTTRLARLEDALESTNAKVERLADAQQFTTRLLTERTDPAGGDRPQSGGSPQPGGG